MSSTASLENLRDSIERYVLQFAQDEGRDDSTVRGRAFARWCCEVIFELPPELSADATAIGGSDDQSIDAIFEDGSGLVVLQAKYGSHEWAEVAKFKQDAERLCTTAPKGGRQAVLEAAAKIRSAVDRDDPIRFIYITNSRFTGRDIEKIGQLATPPAAVEAWELDNINEFLSEKGSSVPSPPKDQQLFLPAAAPPLTFGDSILFPVRLVDCAQFVDRGKSYLFASNVRNFLSKSKVNEEIRSTIRQSPERFWRYNNGITVVCDDWKLVDNTVRLVSPQVVNGCQTAHSIRNVVAILDERQQAALSGEVLVRVIREPDPQERVKITRSTNRQNAVRAKDFFALEDFQKRLQAQFASHGYFYEIQTGSWDQLGDGEHEKYRGDARFNHLKWVRRDYRVPAIESVKCYSAAFRGRIAVCYSNPGELAPGGEQYDEVFPEDLPNEAEPFLVPFLILKDCEARFRYGARAPDFHARSRYLFVATFFRVLHAILHAADRTDLESTVPTVAEVPKVREVVAREELAERLMDLTEETMKSFFRDSWVKRQVGQDIFQFLKGPVEREEPLRIMADKIEDLLGERANKELIAEVGRALPA